MEEAKKLPVRTYPKGMLIFDQGEIAEDVYAVVSGSIEIVRKSADGTLSQIAVLKPGELFGEFSYLAGTPRTTAAIAMEAAELVEIQPSWLTKASTTFPEIQDRINDLYRSRVLFNVLRTNKIFALLEPSEIRSISSKMQLQGYEDGSQILRQGDTGIDVIVVKRGKISVKKAQGSEQVELGELGPGDILGEMAVVTGKPRSASGYADGKTEVMVLPGDDFKEALSTYPKLLTAIEDMVRSRAEQIREAAENLVEDVVGGTWKDTEGVSGIQVDSLNIKTKFTTRYASGTGQLISVSRGIWGIKLEDPNISVASKSNTKLEITDHRIKDLKTQLSKTPVYGTVVSVEDGIIYLALPSVKENQHVPELVTAFARARVRLFIYPDYDVEKLGLAILFQAQSGKQGMSPILKLSQTNGSVQHTNEWVSGEMASITLITDEKEILSTKAVCMGSTGSTLEFQFEYETGEERSTLESFVRDIQRNLGYGQSNVAKPATPPPTLSKNAPILTRHFRNSGDFLKTYMGSMEGGHLRVRTKEELPPDTHVRIITSIATKGSHRRISFTGRIKKWDQGNADIVLDPFSDQLREKVELLCKSAVEQKTEDSWNRRKSELVHSGVAIPSERKKIVQKICATIFGLALLGLLGMWIHKLSQPTPDMLAQNRRDFGQNGTQARSKEVKIVTNGGEVSIRTSQIRSIKVEAGSDAASIHTTGGSFSTTQEELQKLTPYQQKQVERLVALQKAKE